MSKIFDSVKIYGTGTTTSSTLQTFNSGGTNTFLVRDNGNVGIGTSTPTTKLDIDLGSTSGTDVAIQTRGAIPFLVNNRTFFSVNNNGRLTAGDIGGSSNLGHTFAAPIGSSNALKVTSDGSYQGLFSINTDGSFDIGNSVIAGSYFESNGTNIFRFYGSNGGQSQKIGINEITPTATVHIKGSDSLSTNYGLKVQNSGGTDNLVVRNNGNVGIGTSTPTRVLDSRGTFNLEYSSGTYARFDGSVMELQVGNSNNSLLLNKDNTNVTELNGYNSTRVKNNLYLNSIFLESNGSYFRENTQISFRRSDNNQYGLWDSTNYRLKIGNLGLNQELSSITSTLHVLGSDNTSSNYGLKVDNYTGGTNLIVRNDGYFNAGDGNLISYENSNDIFIGSNSNKYKNLKIGPYNTPFMFFEIAASRTTIYTDTIIGGSSAGLVGNTARVKISGDGSLGLRNIGFQYNGTNGNTDYVIGNESDNLNTTIRLSFNPTQFGYPYTATATDANNSWRVGIGIATSSTHRVTISDGLKLISTPYNTTSFVIQTTSGTSLFNVQNDGNVGIGTSTPSETLNIYKSGFTQANILVESDSNTSNLTLHSFKNSQGTSGGSTINFKSLGVSYGDISTNSANSRFVINSSNGYDLFLTNANSAIAVSNQTVRLITNNENRLTVLNNGDIGIGTITPTSKLDITGSTGYNQLRLRTSYTPTSSSDTNGNIGDVAWDDNYFYWKTSTQWLRVSGQTF